MGFSLGIVGLPNVGKSTLFNLLARAKAEVSNYPFCTIKPNIGVVEVPDERLDKIKRIMGSAKAVPTVIEFYDIAGLVKGAHQGEGLGNQFLSHIREVDAIAHVVRCFAGQEIAHVSGAIEPQNDIEIIKAELMLADLAVVEKQLQAIRIKAKAGDKKILKEMAVIERLHEALSSGRSASSVVIAENERDFIKDLPLLTFKPVLYVANVDETGNQDQVELINKLAKQESAKVVSLCAKLEAEIAELSAKEAEELGLKTSGLDQLIRSGYALLDLVTFFTANKKETRAWTIKRNTKAPEAAGKVHSDMARGFISADVVHYNDLVKAGAYAKARDLGILHTEGKNYQVQDGDLLLVKFVV